MAATPQFSTLSYEPEAGVGWIVLNCPDKLNALHSEAWRELARALHQADADPGCGLAAITGSGRAFCAGDDINEFLRLTSEEAARDFFLNDMFPALEAIVTIGKPVFAAVNGIAYGGGCEIVLLCDLAVAAEEARFSLPEGLIGAWPSIFVAVAGAFVGLKQAKALALSCQPIGALEARDLGLVNAVVPLRELRREVQSRAEAILRASPRAIAETKRWLNRELSGAGLQAIRESLEHFARAGCNSPDLIEGSRAFLEKRRPRFGLSEALG